MKAKQTLILALTLLAVAALVGCANPADDKPEAKVSDPVEHAGHDHAAETAETYAIAEGSMIGFVGSKVTGSHDGGFNAFDGEIHVVDGDPTKSHVKLTIDTTSLWADHPKLTEHLKSADFFDVEQFPTATFETTSIVPAAEGEGYTVTGNLDLHGVQKSIEFPAQITLGEDGVTAQAEFFIQRFDFGIVYPGKPDDLIRDEVVIKLDLTATPQV